MRVDGDRSAGAFGLAVIVLFSAITLCGALIDMFPDRPRRR